MKTYHNFNNLFFNVLKIDSNWKIIPQKLFVKRFIISDIEALNINLSKEMKIDLPNIIFQIFFFTR